MNKPESFREDLVRVMLDTSPEGILCVGEDGEILFANHRAESMFGYDPGELPGTPLERLLPDRMRSLHSTQVKAFFSNPRMRHKGSGLSLVGRRRDGSEFAADISLSPTETVVGRVVVAFVADISATRAVENQLAQLQKMEAIGSLVGGLAHDLSNMLTIVIGCSHLAADEVSGTSPAYALLTQALDATYRASDVCRRLLAFVRPQTARPQVAAVNVVVHNTIQMMRRLMPENIELDLAMAENLPNAHIDVGRLEQAIVNLLVNARDAMPGGGKIAIETALVRRDRPDHNSCVVVKVSDTGIGMDEIVKQRLFEPFFTTKGTSGGTGLGLTMVQSTISQAGGEITVESAPGRGTTFRLYIPVANEPSREPGPRSGAEFRGAGTILLVEDEPEVLELVSQLLEESGFHVVAARNADEARERFLQNSRAIRALVTDVVLPAKSGTQLAAELRGINPNLPILFMSGYGEAAAQPAATGANDAFIPKPFTHLELITALRDLLDRA